jgi:hypothetical protein
MGFVKKPRPQLHGSANSLRSQFRELDTMALRSS